MFLAKRTTSSAIDLTWRVEVPETTIMSSVAWRTLASSSGTDGGGLGRSTLMVWGWVWLLKVDRLDKRGGDYTGKPQLRHSRRGGAVQPVDGNVVGHGGRQQRTPGPAGGDLRAHCAG
ncbi:hypothetical protein G6F46_013981 [Rhizopus delemar]|nr:hypothetical protein G6F46_013981 [Rhizopus delemar]